MQFSFKSLHICLLLLAAGVHAIPTPRVTREVSIVRRQDVSKPMTVKTTNTKDTPAGIVTEICEIKLTPVKDDQGKDAVQVVKSCTLQMDASGESNTNGNGGGDNNTNGGGNNNNGGDNNTSASSSNSASNSASSTDSANSSSATGSSSASDSKASSGSASATSSGSSNTSSGSASATSSGSSSQTGSVSAANTSANVSVTDSVNPSQDTVRPTGSSSSASGTGSSSSASATGTSAAASNGSNSSSASSSGTANASASATAANDSASPTTSPTQNFTIPGKNISVLPIGLGVFAGISVIALIVVGLVTYERTKYRKAFRQRKMAESGAAMGYGGMAQRA